MPHPVDVSILTRYGFASLSCIETVFCVSSDTFVRFEIVDPPNQNSPLVQLVLTGSELTFIAVRGSFDLSTVSMDFTPRLFLESRQFVF